MVVIDAENLSKLYQIGHQVPERYATLRDVLASGVKGLGHRLVHPFRSSTGQPFAAATTEDFYALRDVSFQVRQGDRLGIIGYNGAGKSTLLKILSRITEPTSGRVRIRGKVASLLEVGTGFHPELTGRENIFLNGAILGMSRADILRRFDEIVAFADIEKFLDTPVKRYSSGMYVRLAFAVAAHLEPEVLIVDEVLAVGDVSFQKKCLGKMEEVGREGRTVLFVSHNMNAIRSLCSRAILLQQGRIVQDGSGDEVILNYIEESKNQFLNCEIISSDSRLSQTEFTLNLIELKNNQGNLTNTLVSGENFSIRVHYTVHNKIHGYRIGLVIYSSDKVRLSSIVSDFNGDNSLYGEEGTRYVTEASLTNIFAEGSYLMSVFVKNTNNVLVASVENIVLSILPSKKIKQMNRQGFVVVPATWARPVLTEE